MNEHKSSKPLRIPFDSLTLRTVVEELRQKALGGKIQDIRQPSDRDLQIGIRSRGTNLLLDFSIDALYARTNLASVRAANSPVPTAFCMAARKHLEGATIVDIRQIGFDRVLHIDCGRIGDDDAPVVTRLIAEFMGKHSNVILVRSDNTIIESVKRVSDRINRIRQILPGLAYIPPPSPEGAIDPFDIGAADHAAQLMRDNAESDLADRFRLEFIGLSPFLSKELALRIQSSPHQAVSLWREVFAAALLHIEHKSISQKPSMESVVSSTNRIYPGLISAVEIVDERGTLFAYPISSIQVPQDSQTPSSSISKSLEQSVRTRLQRSQFDTLAGQLRGAISKELKRLGKQRADSLRSIIESDRADYYQECGDLILANLWNIEPGLKEIDVPDLFAGTGANRTICVDPAVSPRENAEHYFRRARKSRESLPISLKRVSDSAASIETLNEAQEELEQVQMSADLDVNHVERIKCRLLESGLIQTGEQTASVSPIPKQYDFQGHKIRHFVLESGYEVFLGETATANDFLTTRIAAPTDLWFHVRASTSSHVILRTQGHPELAPQDVIRRTAVLCARHSSQKHSSLVPVDYTLKKYVRKPRKSAPGSVDYIRETTIHVVPSDYERLL